MILINLFGSGGSVVSITVVSSGFHVVVSSGDGVVSTVVSSGFHVVVFSGAGVVSTVVSSGFHVVVPPLSVVSTVVATVVSSGLQVVVSPPPSPWARIRPVKVMVTDVARDFLTKLRRLSGCMAFGICFVVRIDKRGGGHVKPFP